MELLVTCVYIRGSESCLHHTETSEGAFAIWQMHIVSAPVFRGKHLAAAGVMHGSADLMAKHMHACGIQRITIVQDLVLSHQVCAISVGIGISEEPKHIMCQCDARLAD